MERRDMERIEVYSSRGKAFWMLVLCLLFVIAGAYLVLEAENFEHKNAHGVRAAGILSILFFGAGIFISIGRLLRNRLVLTIDAAGININPEKSPSERIGWKNIEGFSQIEIKGAKIIIIVVNNPDHWIENERNAVRKKMMKFNLNHCGTPFSISPGITRLRHDELWKILNENLKKYHPQANRH